MKKKNVKIVNGKTIHLSEPTVTVEDIQPKPLPTIPDSIGYGFATFCRFLSFSTCKVLHHSTTYHEYAVACDSAYSDEPHDIIQDMDMIMAIAILEDRTLSDSIYPLLVLLSDTDIYSRKPSRRKAINMTIRQYMSEHKELKANMFAYMKKGYNHRYAEKRAVVKKEDSDVLIDLGNGTYSYEQEFKLFPKVTMNEIASIAYKANISKGVPKLWIDIVKFRAIGYNNRQIAEMLGISPSTVSRQYRKLHEHFEPYYDYFMDLKSNK